MKRFLLVLVALLAAGFLAWSFLFHEGGLASYSFGDAVERTASGIARDAASILETSKAVVEKTVSAPPPLRTTLSGPGESLSVEGVLRWTNAHRAEVGLPPLELDSALSEAADAKVSDMFAGQYFAHDSPAGVGPSDLVGDVGYEYIAVGENLALGNYDGDEALVQAWMDSPGHRENILASAFTEIGISVKRGEYEGHMTWLAVQEFARPSSDCPSPDDELSSAIAAHKAELETLQKEAETLLADIESSPEPKNQGQAESYNAKVAKYNQTVQRINVLIRTIQGEITVYNGQVQAFNACVNG